MAHLSLLGTLFKENNKIECLNWKPKKLKVLIAKIKKSWKFLMVISLLLNTSKEELSRLNKIGYGTKIA